MRASARNDPRLKHVRKPVATDREVTVERHIGLPCSGDTAAWAEISVPLLAFLESGPKSMEQIRAWARPKGCCLRMEEAIRWLLDTDKRGLVEVAHQRSDGGKVYQLAGKS